MRIIEKEMLAAAIKGLMPLMLNKLVLAQPLWVADDEEGVLCLINQLANMDRAQCAEKTILLGPVECLGVALQPAKYMIPNVPDGMIGAIPLLEDWGVVHRCFSKTFMPGAFEGELEALLKVWPHYQQCAHFKTYKRSWVRKIKA